MIKYPIHKSLIELREFVLNIVDSYYTHLVYFINLVYFRKSVQNLF